MLNSNKKVALFMQGALNENFGKLGLAALRYSQNEIVCVVDSDYAGKDAEEVTGIPRSAPIVSSVDEAVVLGSEVLILGIAPPGGLIPQDWYPALDSAIEHGLSIVNGLHDLLSPRYQSLKNNQWVWDIRQEPKGITVATGDARKLTNKRVVYVGTDMSVGKMTAGLETLKSALDRGIKAEFIATGQVGIVLTGKGIPLDCIRVDFAGGALEREVLEAKDADLVLIEGQGSLAHPGSSAPLPLIRGAMPTHFVICHRAGMEFNPRIDWLKIPEVAKLASLYEDLAEACGTFARPKTAAVSLITMHLGEDEALEAIAKLEQETGLPTTDPVRFGASKIVDALGF